MIKFKTMQFTLILSILFHIFFISYLNILFEETSAERPFEKSSSICISLEQNGSVTLPVKNSVIPEQKTTPKIQDRFNQDKNEKNLVKDKTITTNVLSKPKNKPVVLDKKEKEFSSEKITSKAYEEINNILTDKDNPEHILPKEKSDCPEKKIDKVRENRLESLKKIDTGKKSLLEIEEELSAETKKTEILPVQYPEVKENINHQDNLKPEKKLSETLLKNTKEVLKNKSDELNNTRNQEKDLEIMSENKSGMPVIGQNQIKKEFPEKIINQCDDHSQRENIEDKKNDDDYKVQKRENEVIEEILDFTGGNYTENITPPRLKEYEYPIYPGNLRERDIEGKVKLEVLIDREGGVKEIKILQSSGYKAFDDSAIVSVQKWQFKPASKAERQMFSRIIIPISFQIK